ncbi:tetratricopeptide repeat protein [Nonomuraea sp. NPDC050790]|uniref:tetratricopeptide repeat protein n=1 Tax=Nonomuraea sp. NPDC050790 TaxID=3364371 RepID=UPI0037B37131
MMTSHHVAMAELWRSRRRADLVPDNGDLSQQVSWLLAALWLEATGGVAEHAAELEETLGDALKARAESWHAELNGLLGLVLIARGMLARESGDHAASGELFARALEVAPPSFSPPPYALALLHTGRREEAARVMAEADDTDSPYAAYAQVLLAEDGDPYAALDLADRACARWAGDVRLARLRLELAERLGKLTPAAWRDLGGALLEAGRHEEALGALLQADRDDPDILEWLALAFQSIGDHESAADAATEAARRRPGATLHLDAADACARAHRRAQAREHVDAALSAENDHVVRFAAAQILLGTGDMARALELVREIRNDLPGDPRALIVEGIALFGVGQVEESERTLTRAAELMPGEPVVLRHLAVARLDLGRLEEAAPLLDQALELDPEDGWMLAVRGDLRGRLMDLTGARQDLDGAARLGFENAWTLRAQAQVAEADDPAEALRLLDRSLERDPENAAAHAARGKILYGLKRITEADEAFQRALEIDPLDPRALTKLTEFWLPELPVAEVADLRNAVEAAVERTPDYIPLRWAYSEILSRQEQTKDAHDVARQITRMTPRDAEDHRLLGLAHSKLDEREAAVAAFRAGIDLAPGYAALHAHLGVELSLADRREEAERELAKAVELNGDYAFARARLGGALLALGRFEEAEPHLRRAIELWPEATDPLLDLAEVLRMTRRPEEGLELAEQAVRLAPSAFAIGSRGQLYFSLQRLPEARADLERAVEMDPELSWARGTLAEVYRMTGDLDDAIAHATRAIPQSDDSRWLLAVRGAARYAKGAYGEAESDLREAAELLHPGEPVDLLALVMLRNTLQRLGRGEEAVRFLREHAMNGSAVNREADPQVVVHYSEALQYDGRLDEAREVLHQAARVWPEEPEIHSARAWLEAAMGRHEAALEAAGRALDLAPDNAERLYVLGSIQRTARDPLAAIRSLTKAVEAEPDAAWIWAELSITLSYVAAWDLAIEAGLEATAPGRQVTAYCEEMLAWAYRYRETPDLELALAAYDRALALDAGSTGAMAGKGDTLFSMGAREGAEECYEAVLDALSPYDPDHLSTRGWCLYRLGRYQESLDYYQQYQAVKPDRPSFLLFDLALLAWAEGDDEAARTAYDHALDQAFQETPQRTRGLIEVAIRDLESDRRGDLETQRELIAHLHGKRADLPKYEPPPRL